MNEMLEHDFSTPAAEAKEKPYPAWNGIDLGRFFDELKRRHVYRVAIAYGVVAWLLVQIATQVFPFFEIPNWVVRLVVLITILGFPAAVIIAWAFEMTPEGLKRADEVRSNEDVPRWSTRKFAALVVTIAIIAAGVPLVHLLRTKPAFLSRVSAASALSEKSIAVLPLINEGGGPNEEYFSDGLSEELIAALAQVKGLKVIGRSSSFRFKDQNQDSKVIGQKLGVSTLLEGTIRKQGDRVRIVAELVNAADGSELWSRTFDRELKDIFAVQAEIAQAVATSLELTFANAKDNRGRNGPTNSVEAHNAYLQGHFYFQRRSLEDYGKAVGFFDQAIRLDPEYALAYAERSEAWSWIGDLTSEQQKVAWSKAARDAEKAVAIEPQLAEAHAALGWVRFFVEWKIADGLAELRWAQQLAPWNPTANDLLARVMVYLGQFDEAEKLARQAIGRDPLAYQARSSLARLLFVQGKLDEADASARKAAELQPTAAGNHRWQVFVAIQHGDGEAALREAQLEPDERYRRFELALAHYARHDGPAADVALAELIARDRNVMAYQIAEVYAWRGENDKAFDWLQVSLNNHDTGLLSLLIDPLIRSLQHDPRYTSVLAKVGLARLVTGGNSGIGLATAKEFVNEGAHVFITGRREKELATAARQIGKNVTAVQGDVSNLEDLDRLFAQIKKEKDKLDMVFANAGIAKYGALGEITEEFYDSIFDINVKDVLFTVQKGLPLLRDGGSIVLNASIVASKGLSSNSFYSATKAAVRSFARTWITDLKYRRSRVNAISPGPIDTPGLSELLASSDVGQERKQMISSAVPLGRLGTPDEIAKAVVFPASDDASYITGIELFVDGGFAQI